MDLKKELKNLVEICGLESVKFTLDGIEEEYQAGTPEYPFGGSVEASDIESENNK